ncbi:signal transduction histidine kinase [Paenibacillus taihuensis]|uniref:histidine kinase n=1 Tax=Paenibacillus taihuensis TaxID=1156355 RepID=A0A3D9QC51_9BACL|nr:ATP-binding protein [Paenibacillus taihuensis]REE57529.1 signal transduction histidine kinase [Paenibacillus taihuensis]
MANTILYRILLPVLLVIISFSSIYLERTYYPYFMVAAGIAVYISINAKQSNNRQIYIQIALLVLFHWLSQLNWCLSIYLILLIRQIARSEDLIRSILHALLIMALYSLIRLSYSVTNGYAVLVTLSDLASTLVIVALVWMIKSREIEKRNLEQLNDELLKKDALTGLLNYHEFRRELSKMKDSSEYCLIIMNCQDLRVINFKHGYEQANNNLKDIAGQLERYFNPALISRYGGSEFAIAVAYTDGAATEGHIQQAIAQIIEHSVDLDIIYAYAFSNRFTTEETIENVEKQLFLQKKDIWMKRDEHFFRADKLKVIGELAAGMAHEIRNPLTTIKGFLQLAYQNDYKEFDRYHPMIMDEITRVSELTSEFLQFSKPNLFQMKAESVQSCIERAISIMGTEIERRGHHLSVEYPEAPLYVKVDKDKIVQVLVNLFKNSIDAMADLGHIGVKVYGVDSEVFIEMMDTGTGMSEATKEKLFEPFYTTKGHGTGLGLSISHKIVQDHGGRMDVKETSAKGTVFLIVLPLVFRAAAE